MKIRAVMDRIKSAGKGLGYYDYKYDKETQTFTFKKEAQNYFNAHYVYVFKRRKDSLLTYSNNFYFFPGETKIVFDFKEDEMEYEEKEKPFFTFLELNFFSLVCSLLDSLDYEK